MKKIILFFFKKRKFTKERSDSFLYTEYKEVSLVK